MKPGWIVAATLGVTLAGLATAGPPRAAEGGITASPAAHEDPPGLLSPYGILTSDRWAYGHGYQRRDLVPVKNPNPMPEPQPHRDHPYKLAITQDGTKVYVTLPGNEVQPGHEVAVYSTRERRVIKRIRTGSRPWFVRMHPDGRHALVTNLYSNYVSVIDTTLDEVTSEIPADFYCQDIAFDPAGARAYLANRYLGQVLVAELHVAGDRLEGGVVPRGGFDDASFRVDHPPAGSPREILVRRCGNASCHGTPNGGFYAGADRARAFVSAVENAVPGDADASLLLRAARPCAQGGFADEFGAPNNHAAGVVALHREDADDKALSSWIAGAGPGPGIPVGNDGSRPMDLAMSADGRRLYVGNIGVQTIGIIDLEQQREVAGIYLQNLPLDVALYHPARGGDWLIAASMGIGFGAPKERDPYGGETEDRDNPAAEFSVLRDTKTTEPLPLARQKVLGPFDAIDGTAASKMRDIQNDLVAVNLKMLTLPPPVPGKPLLYALLANRYEAHDAWVRYTSDSAEAMQNDVAGDIPPDLMRVVGAMPMSLDIEGDDLLVAMQGTFELVRYRIDPQATEPSDLLSPVAVYPTGLLPRCVVAGHAGTVAHDRAFVANYLGETITDIDLATGSATQVVVGDLAQPVPSTNSERGEIFVNTAVFSVDQDTGCSSCHIYDTSDDRGWGAGQVIGQSHDGRMVSGGLLAVPQLRGLHAIQPFYFEGTHTDFDAQFDDAREHVSVIDFAAPVPAGDFTAFKHPLDPAKRPDRHDEIQEKVSTAPLGTRSWDLEEARDQFIRLMTMKFFGKAFDFRDFQRFIGEYQAAETRLLPNPYDSSNTSVARGRALFNSTVIGCSNCHPGPNFASKSETLAHNPNRAVPSLVTMTRRDASFTLISPSYMDRVNGFVPDVQPWEKGRVKLDQGRFTSFQLRGLFDRPRTLLHQGNALSLREVLCVPGHYALGTFRYVPLRGGEVARPDGREEGLNANRFATEGTYTLDLHGATSHLNACQIRDLENLLLTLE